MQPALTSSKTLESKTVSSSSWFSDAYQVLEALQTVERPQETIAATLLLCHKLLEHLERITRIIETPGFDNQGVLINSSLQTRQHLDAFKTTCLACRLALAPVDQPQSESSGRCLPSTQWLRRRTQLRDFQEEFLVHWRSLTLVLTSVSYTVCQYMQRSSKASRADFASMLRQIEIRHRQFEDLNVRAVMDSSKGGLAKFESSQWDSCLRLFFEAFEQSPKSSLPGASLSLFPSTRSALPSKDRDASSAKVASVPKSHAQKLAPISIDPSCRALRDKSSPIHPTSKSIVAPTKQPMTPPVSPITKTDYYVQTLYHQASRSIQQSLRQDDHPRHVKSSQTGLGIRDTSIASPDRGHLAVQPQPSMAYDQVPWERMAMDLGGALVHDLITECPRVWQTQQEVIWETRNMSILDARRHAQHCFSQFPRHIVEQLERRIMQQKGLSPSCPPSDWWISAGTRDDPRLTKTVGPTAAEFSLEQTRIGNRSRRHHNNTPKGSTSTRTERPKSEPLFSQFPTIRTTASSFADGQPTDGLLHELAATNPSVIGDVSPQLPPIFQSPLMFPDMAVPEKRASRVSVSIGEEKNSRMVPPKRSSLFDIAGSILSPRPGVSTGIRPKGATVGTPRSDDQDTPPPTPAGTLDALLVDREILDPLTKVARAKLAEQIKVSEAAQVRRTSSYAGQRKSPPTPKSPSLTRKVVMSTLRTMDNLRSSQIAPSSTKSRPTHLSSRSISSPIHLYTNQDITDHRKTSKDLDLASSYKGGAPPRSPFRPLSNIRLDPRLSMGGLEIYMDGEDVTIARDDLPQRGSSVSSDGRCPTLGSLSSLESMNGPITPKKSPAVPRPILSPLRSHPIAQSEFSAVLKGQGSRHPVAASGLPSIILTGLDEAMDLENWHATQRHSVFELDASHESMIMKAADERNDLMLLAPEEGDGFCGSWSEFTSSLNAKRLSRYVR